MNRLSQNKPVRYDINDPEYNYVSSKTSTGKELSGERNSLGRRKNRLEKLSNI